MLYLAVLFSTITSSNLSGTTWSNSNRSNDRHVYHTIGNWDHQRKLYPVASFRPWARTKSKIDGHIALRDGNFFLVQNGKEHSLLYDTPDHLQFSGFRWIRKEEQELDDIFDCQHLKGTTWYTRNGKTKVFSNSDKVLFDIQVTTFDESGKERHTKDELTNACPLGSGVELVQYAGDDEERFHLNEIHDDVLIFEGFQWTKQKQNHQATMMNKNLSDRKSSLEIKTDNAPSDASASSRNVTSSSNEGPCVRPCAYKDFRLNHGKSLEHSDQNAKMVDENLSDRKASLETDMGNTPSESSTSSRNVTTGSSERSCVLSCGYNDIRLNHGKSLEHASSSIETAQSSGENLRFQSCPYQDYRYRDGSAAKNPSSKDEYVADNFDGSDDSNWFRRETSSQELWIKPIDQTKDTLKCIDGFIHSYANRCTKPDSCWIRKYPTIEWNETQFLVQGLSDEEFQELKELLHASHLASETEIQSVGAYKTEEMIIKCAKDDLKSIENAIWIFKTHDHRNIKYKVEENGTGLFVYRLDKNQKEKLKERILKRYSSSVDIR